ncbi:LON peptidase substrate-binding domain-containing protein [Xanthobacter oligotrophicus]|uniref:LON peptidase substrate-binding domain-containing protein n=1 Tax=Xanthobacter oligotrophicus TaxID=2607286 RepID=UPI0011F1CCEC|nr:LON peptidase substrate-binding domain-containing protein [Xanthobacter oligotrophicus]MCG5234997.1 LON peptidase substrate-binding domain-containing protein [Xanthobacter oligotrophicus]
MAANRTYLSPTEIPPVIPVFPLTGALLLPRADLPLNIFEPRYLAMVDDALGGARLIGMVQPDEQAPVSAHGPGVYKVGCLGRLTQFSETGDGRYLITLTGICRFRIVEELDTTTPYRQFKVDATAFAHDFEAEAGEAEVDRDALLSALAAFLDANKLEADWDGIREAGTETLVNALSVMSPYGALEKQALLEAENLKARADMLVAITQMMLARMPGDGEGSLQ